MDSSISRLGKLVESIMNDKIVGVDVKSLTTIRVPYSEYEKESINLNNYRIEISINDTRGPFMELVLLGSKEEITKYLSDNPHIEIVKR